MDVLGIDEATTHARLHINQVEFYDTGNGSPFFRINSITRLLFTGQLQIYT